jgi:glycosyltransferase involved in cell wall biosynthesis
MKMLKEHGHKVILYSRNNSELKKMNKVQKLMLPITTIFNPRTYKDIKRIVKQEKIDIVHVHNTLNLVSPSVYYAALKCKVPVVQTIHNFRMLCPGATFYRDGHICEDCLKYGLSCSIKHDCYRNSKLQTLACVISVKIHRLLGIYKKINYICLTEFTKEKIQSVAAKERIYIKPNFVYDFGGETKPEDYYVFVGRLEEIKGIDVLIDAFKQMPNKKIKVVGTGILDEKIRNRVRYEQLNNIELVGFKTRTEVNQIVKGAKALIMCSQWYETFGMVIVEAYSNGVPVIVGNIGNIKDLVIEGETGELFQYNSSEALVEAVERFEKKYDSSYGYNGYKLYKEKFSPDVNYKILMGIYQNVNL